jgi:hypothetical protein
MNTETTGVENTPPEHEAHRKSGIPPPTVMASTKNLIRLKSDLKKGSKESTSSEIHEMEHVTLGKKWWTIQLSATAGNCDYMCVSVGSQFDYQ